MWLVRNLVTSMKQKVAAVFFMFFLLLIWWVVNSGFGNLIRPVISLTLAFYVVASSKLYVFAICLNGIKYKCKHVRDVCCSNFCFSFIVFVFSCFDCCPLYVRVCLNTLRTAVMSGLLLIIYKCRHVMTPHYVIRSHRWNGFFPRFGYCIRPFSLRGTVTSFRYFRDFPEHRYELRLLFTSAWFTFPLFGSTPSLLSIHFE